MKKKQTNSEMDDSGDATGKDTESEESREKEEDNALQNIKKDTIW